MSNSARMETVAEERDHALSHLVTVFMDGECGFDGYEHDEYEATKVRLRNILNKAILVDLLHRGEIQRLTGA